VQEVILIPDYKELYYQLFRRTEQAIQILEKAQREAEAAYLAQENPPLHFSPVHKPPTGH
jgi:hypothetical protein